MTRASSKSGTLPHYLNSIFTCKSIQFKSMIQFAFNHSPPSLVVDSTISKSTYDKIQHLNDNNLKFMRLVLNLAQPVYRSNLDL